MNRFCAYVSFTRTKADSSGLLRTSVLQKMSLVVRCGLCVPVTAQGVESVVRGGESDFHSEK